VFFRDSFFVYSVVCLLAIFRVYESVIIFIVAGTCLDECDVRFLTIAAHVYVELCPLV